MLIKEHIRANYDEFVTLCQLHEVKTIHAFGSSTNSEFNPATSDIDLLIDIQSKDPIIKGKNLINIWDRLETFFNREVDLVTHDSIRNPVLRENIDSTKVLIYDERYRKIPV